MIRPGFLSSADRLELEALRASPARGTTALPAGGRIAILLLDDGKSCKRFRIFCIWTTIPFGAGIKPSARWLGALLSTAGKAVSPV